MPQLRLIMDGTLNHKASRAAGELPSNLDGITNILAVDNNCKY